MVEAWLVELMTSYNRDSRDQRNGYVAQLHMPGDVFQSLVWWALQSLPDEILVGLDIAPDQVLSLIHISEPRDKRQSRMPSSA